MSLASSDSRCETTHASIVHSQCITQLLHPKAPLLEIRGPGVVFNMCPAGKVLLLLLITPRLLQLLLLLLLLQEQQR